MAVVKHLKDVHVRPYCLDPSFAGRVRVKVPNDPRTWFRRRVTVGSRGGHGGVMWGSWWGHGGVTWRSQWGHMGVRFPSLFCSGQHPFQNQGGVSSILADRGQPFLLGHTWLVLVRALPASNTLHPLGDQHWV